MTRYLIVNADDFGLSEGVNRGIIETIERGILTSASLMVRQPAAESAAAYVRKGSRLSLGLHLDLGEWFNRDGEWVPLYSVVSTEDTAAVAREVASQLDTFRRLVGHDPTHLDSHQHVHRQEPVRSIVVRLAQRLHIPLRESTPGIPYCGAFYGQDGEGATLPGALSTQALKQLLASLPQGITELGCHPGYGDGLATAYRNERALEVETLCAPAVRQTLKKLDIELCSFAGLPRALPRG